MTHAKNIDLHLKSGSSQRQNLAVIGLACAGFGRQRFARWAGEHGFDLLSRTASEGFVARGAAGGATPSEKLAFLLDSDTFRD